MSAMSTRGRASVDALGRAAPPLRPAVAGRDSRRRWGGGRLAGHDVGLPFEQQEDESDGDEALDRR